MTGKETAAPKRSTSRDIALGIVLIAIGATVSGGALMRMAARYKAAAQSNPQPATAPEPEVKPVLPRPEDTRPTTPAPEPARPSDDAQKAGAKPALPPAPAEKTAPPIPAK